MICTVIMFAQDPLWLASESLGRARLLPGRLIAHLHRSRPEVVETAREVADEVMTDERERFQKGRQLTRIMARLDELEPEWVVMLDGDDLVTPDFAESAREVAKSDLTATQVRYRSVRDSEDYEGWPCKPQPRSVMWRWRPGLSFRQDPVHSSMRPRQVADEMRPVDADLVHGGYRDLARRLAKHRRDLRYREELGFGYRDREMYQPRGPVPRDRAEDWDLTLDEALEFWAQHEQERRRQSLRPSVVQVPAAVDFTAWNLHPWLSTVADLWTDGKADPTWSHLDRFTGRPMLPGANEPPWCEVTGMDADVGLLMATGRWDRERDVIAKEVSQRAKHLLLVNHWSPALAEDWRIVGSGGCLLCERKT